MAILYKRLNIDILGEGDSNDSNWFKSHYIFKVLMNLKHFKWLLLKDSFQKIQIGIWVKFDNMAQQQSGFSDLIQGMNRTSCYKSISAKVMKGFSLC